MPNTLTGHLRFWISYGACAWAVLFAAPHAWWALGVPAGFPGGETSYRAFMSSSWLYLYNLAVIELCIVAVILTVKLLHPAGEALLRWVMRTAVWVASGALLLRGFAGLVVDGTSDPIWWPTFLVGGILFGGVAWLARASGSEAPTP